MNNYSMSPKIAYSKLPQIYNELDLDNYFNNFSNLNVSGSDLSSEIEEQPP
jgi:hypothetical protein